MLDAGLRIGFGGGFEGKPDGLRLGVGGTEGDAALRDAGVALMPDSGGRLRFGGGGGWLVKARPCATESGG